LDKTLKILRAALLAWAFAAAPGAVASDAQANAPYDVDSDFLAEACTVIGQTTYGKISYFDCYSYFYGVLDSYHSFAAFKGGG